MKYNVYIEDVSVEAVFNKMGGVAGAKRFLADELLLTEAPKPEAIPEPPLDFIIRVDRTAKLTYLDWMKKLEHPDLELTGPAEFDLKAGVEQWLAKGQDTETVQGHAVYNQLKKENALESCLGLADLLAIQAKGIAVFRALYKRKAVFGWKSVVQLQDGDLNAPYLIELEGKVVLNWYWLDHNWYAFNPGLRFGK